jgi:hypothetical protein
LLVDRRAREQIEHRSPHPVDGRRALRRLHRWALDLIRRDARQARLELGQRDAGQAGLERAPHALAVTARGLRRQLERVLHGLAIAPVRDRREHQLIEAEQAVVGVDQSPGERDQITIGPVRVPLRERERRSDHPVQIIGRARSARLGERQPARGVVEPAPLYVDPREVDPHPAPLGVARVSLHELRQATSEGHASIERGAHPLLPQRSKSSLGLRAAGQGQLGLGAGALARAAVHEAGADQRGREPSATRSSAGRNPARLHPTGRSGGLHPDIAVVVNVIGTAAPMGVPRR